MQIKIFSIPIMGGEAITEELNAFLRSKKIIQVDQHFVQGSQGVAWTFCIKYTEDFSAFNKSKEKIDYKEVLDEATFKRFSKMREIRKQVAKEQGVPAYAVFIDEEMAEMAKLPALTLAGMKKIKGIGEKKLEKYGHYFVEKEADEKS